MTPLSQETVEASWQLLNFPESSGFAWNVDRTALQVLN